MLPALPGFDRSPAVDGGLAAVTDHVARQDRLSPPVRLAYVPQLRATQQFLEAVVGFRS
jgi:hypothetical protein